VTTALLLINAGAGPDGVAPGRTTGDQLVGEAERRGIATRTVEQHEDLAAVARDADAAALGMAGGDGSIGTVAAIAIERDLPFVCVPFGTRNHFARDIGLDRDDPVAALDAFTGEERRVDVGRVGERVFVNNVSLGVYARLVHRRERHRKRRDALARLRALALVARRPRPLRVTVDGTPVTSRVVLVANNAYRLDLFSVGERDRLDDGLLHLYAPCGFLRRSWEERTGTRFVVDARRHRLRAAIDGEPAILETPLEFTIEPGALRLLVPPGT
jgi:diacylglycerol kinase family enzyme